MIPLRDKRLKEANYSNGDYYHYTYDAVGTLQNPNDLHRRVDSDNYLTELG
jgi:hypothetical protein